MARQSRGETLGVYIFSASIAMVGVCLTVIGVLSIDPRLRPIAHGSDFLLSLASLAYLVSGILAYMMLRAEKYSRSLFFIRVTETFFILALAITVLICILLAYEYI